MSVVCMIRWLVDQSIAMLPSIGRETNLQPKQEDRLRLMLQAHLGHHANHRSVLRRWLSAFALSR